MEAQRTVFMLKLTEESLLVNDVSVHVELAADDVLEHAVEGAILGQWIAFL